VIAAFFVLFGFAILSLLVMGLCVMAADLNKRLSAIEQAEAEAEAAVDVWYSQAPATVTEKGLES
jgi:hypothetical protein